jgi:hypothetical protein
MKYLKYGDKGPRVKLLQKLLNNNKYFKPRRPLVEDGEFGPLTSSAIQRAKRRLGYLAEDIEPIAGERLFSYLDNSVDITPEMMKLRKARLAQIEKDRDEQSEVNKMRLKALGIIKGEIGTLERPNHSNDIKYCDYWGWGKVAYCVIGCSWAWIKAGSKAFIKGSRWAGCREMLADAKSGGHGIHLTNDPDPGCPGVVDLYGDAGPDHCITFVKDNGNGTCSTVEFNTSKNGVEGVWNNARLLRDCWWFSVEK